MSAILMAVMAILLIATVIIVIIFSSEFRKYHLCKRNPIYWCWNDWECSDVTGDPENPVNDDGSLANYQHPAIGYEKLIEYCKVNDCPSAWKDITNT